MSVEKGKSYEQNIGHITNGSKQKAIKFRPPRYKNLDNFSFVSGNSPQPTSRIAWEIRSYECFQVTHVVRCANQGYQPISREAVVISVPHLYPLARKDTITRVRCQEILSLKQENH
jgi:hypothetical protein